MRSFGACDLQGSYKIKLLESKLKDAANQTRITQFFKSNSDKPVLKDMSAGLPEGQGLTRVGPDWELFMPDLLADDVDSDSDGVPFEGAAPHAVPGAVPGVMHIYR